MSIQCGHQNLKSNKSWYYLQIKMRYFNNGGNTAIPRKKFTKNTGCQRINTLYRYVQTNLIIVIVVSTGRLPLMR